MLFDTDGTGVLSEYQMEEFFRSLVPECPLLQDIEVNLLNSLSLSFLSLSFLSLSLSLSLTLTRSHSLTHKHKYTHICTHTYL